MAVVAVREIPATPLLAAPAPKFKPPYAIASEAKPMYSPAVSKEPHMEIYSNQCLHSPFFKTIFLLT